MKEAENEIPRGRLLERGSEMSTDLNRIMIIGRLTKDPELRATQAGTAVCSFSIANNKTWGKGGEKKEEVSFFNCTAWAKTGEVIAEYVKKGQRIAIDGRLQQRSWEDTAGAKRCAVEIVVDNFQFIEPKGGEKSLAKTSGIFDGTVVNEAPPIDDDFKPF